VPYEKPINEHGAGWIRLDRCMLDKLKSHRRPGERFSDVILRLAWEDNLTAVLPEGTELDEQALRVRFMPHGKVHEIGRAVRASQTR
jgi:hypothetical protein